MARAGCARRSRAHERPSGGHPVGLAPDPNLAVEPQEVVLGLTESADRCLRFYAAVRPMPIISVQPDWKLGGAAIGCGVGLGISPLPERGLDEALRLAVGFGRIGLGADVFDTEVGAGVPESEGFIARPVVGHDPLDLDAEVFVVSHRRLEEGHCAIGLLVRFDLGEGDAGMVVDADMDILPTCAPTAASSTALTGSIPTEEMAHLLDASELFDIDVDHLAGDGTLIAAHRFGRLQVASPV